MVERFKELYTGPIEERVILLYTVTSRSTRMMENRLIAAQIEYEAIRVGSIEGLEQVVYELFRLSDDILDVISPRSHLFMENDIWDMKFSELVKFTARNPGILRSLILVNTYGQVFPGLVDPEDLRRGSRK